jgi:hypothetical protein
VASNDELDLRILDSDPDAVTAVRELLASIREALQDSLLAAWFDGSIALGAFDPRRSDVDVVVVTRDTPSAEQTAAIRTLHARSATAAGAWADDMETIYVTRAGLRSTAVSRKINHLYVERGSGGKLKTAPLDRGWLFHLRVLREHGRSIVGPQPLDMVEAVSDDELKHVALWIADHWLTAYREDPAVLEQLGARVFVVMTICRLLYTLRTGQVVAKMTAAREAVGMLPRDLVPVIEGAMAWRKDDTASENLSLEGTLALMAWMQSFCGAWRRRVELG